MSGGRAAGFRVRRISEADEPLVAVVAADMRTTLVEVLGAERGGALYTDEWLRDRVRAHLDPRRLDGALFLADDLAGLRRGQLLARSERDGGRPIGLIATVFVAADWRGRGVASALFDAGEAWLRSRGCDETAYDTAEDHAAMAALLAGRGYEVSHREPAIRMLRWTRRY